MEIVKTSFGGVLVKTNHGNFAINAGGTMEEMERVYVQNNTPPKALILTTEHIHRSKNAVNYSLKHGIPLIGSFIAFAKQKIQIPERWDVFLPRTIVIGFVTIRMFFVKYDSIDAFALTISDESDSVGIIPDGKLTLKWGNAIQQLSLCNQIYFGNIKTSFPNSSKSLYNRYKSNYNTLDEIEDLFKEYKGTRIFEEKGDTL